MKAWPLLAIAALGACAPTTGARVSTAPAAAPMVAWAMFPEAALTVTQGEPKTINSSSTALRSFCADCGTGLFYRNAAVVAGMVDVQTATLDDPEALPPTLQSQLAERLDWMTRIDELPGFERYPGG